MGGSRNHMEGLEMATTGGSPINGIVHHFEEMEDPRSHVNRLHLLVDVTVILIPGVLADAREQWLKKHLLLPNGIPSRDTI